MGQIVYADATLLYGPIAVKTVSIMRMCTLKLRTYFTQVTKSHAPYLLQYQNQNHSQQAGTSSATTPYIRTQHCKYSSADISCRNKSHVGLREVPHPHLRPTPLRTTLKHNGARLEGLHDLAQRGLEQSMEGIVGCAVLQGHVHGVVLAYSKGAESTVTMVTEW